MANLFSSPRHTFLALMTASLLSLVTGPRAGARPQSPTTSTSPGPSVLTSADIVRELQLAEPPEQIIQQVRRHHSAFTNLDDLFTAIRAAATPETAVNLQQLTLEIAAAVARGGIPAPTADVTAAMPSKPAAISSPPAVTKTPPPYSEDRFAEARGVSRLGNVPPYKWTCDSPVPPKNPSKPAKPLPTFEFYWKTGTSLPSDIDKTAISCIELRPEFNDILFNPEFTLTALPPQGTAFDLLKEAVTALTNLPFGASAGASPTNDKAATTKQTKNFLASKPACPADFPAHITSAVNAGAAFQDALKQIDPGKDANGKIIYVERSITFGQWPRVQQAYGAFEDAVAAVTTDLRNEHADVCERDSVLAPAIAVTIDAFEPAQKAYAALLVHAAETDSTVRFTTPLESTSNYDATVKPTYGGGDTNAASKTVRLSASHQLLTASAGVLITQLPAPSYTSKTVPAGLNNSMTQNVLGIDYGRGPRPALVALLNFHPPVSWLDRRQFGFGLSGGPVFDISNGKADTSRFGFFGGASIRLGEYVYLTPGIHVGEFADLPQGFTAPGQVIPPNTGTPVGAKRYTARFAMGITIKVRSILQAPTKTTSDTTTAGSKPSSTNAKP